MTLLRDIARAVVWMAPASPAKNRVLRALGHDIHPSARLRSNGVWQVDKFSVGPGAHVDYGNLFRHLTMIIMGAESHIGRFNTATAHPVFSRSAGGGQLELADHATITSRHSIDCSATVTVGPFAIVAGHGSRLMTHAIDLKVDAQSARPISFGERSFVGTDVLVLGGAVLPPRSVLGGGAVLLPGRGTDAPGLFAGVPAKRVGDVSGAWFDRTGTHTRRAVVTDEDGTERTSDF